VYFGPVWDFDISLGNIDYNDNWYTDGFWVARIGYAAHAFKNAEFREDVKADWAKLYMQMPAIRTYMKDLAKSLDEPQKRNFARWPILSTYVWPNQVITGSYEGEVQYLTNWLDARTEWMNLQYGQ
jgi:hypothetical protein